jgi:hypothetical protein
MRRQLLPFADFAKTSPCEKSKPHGIHPQQHVAIVHHLRIGSINRKSHRANPMAFYVFNLLNRD